jgi:hypothetical protein
MINKIMIKYNIINNKDKDKKWNKNNNKEILIYNKMDNKLKDNNFKMINN